MLGQFLLHHHGRGDGIGRIRENGHDPVARMFDFAAMIGRQRIADDGVMGAHHLLCAHVPQFLGHFGRADQVREHHDDHTLGRCLGGLVGCKPVQDRRQITERLFVPVDEALHGGATGFDHGFAF